MVEVVPSENQIQKSLRDSRGSIGKLAPGIPVGIYVSKLALWENLKKWLRKGISKKGKDQDQGRDEVNMHVARFFYECGIPSNAINSRSFEIMCEAIGQYEPGYKPPSFCEVRVPLLGKAVERTNKLKKHEAVRKQLAVHSC